MVQVGRQVQIRPAERASTCSRAESRGLDRRLLRNVVNINPHRLDRLEMHVAALSGYLGKDSERSSIGKGPGQEFDGDLLVRMKRQASNWSADPRQYLLACTRPWPRAVAAAAQILEEIAAS